MVAHRLVLSLALLIIVLADRNVSALQDNEIVCTIIDSNTRLCDGVAFVENQTEHFDEPSSPTFWIDIVTSVILVLCAGMFSGLTLGLLSIDLLNLEIISHSGPPKDRERAARIMPLLKRHHLLLVTLLLANAAAMEALPIFLDRMMHPLLAIILSVSVVLVFGEVIPQAVCSRYGLAIGATMAPFVYFLMAMLFVIAWPISKILDFVLGANHFKNYRRAELAELVALHEDAHGGHGGEDNKELLSADESLIIRGALSMRTKTVSMVMTPIGRLFSVNTEAPITPEVLTMLAQQGFSRVPVYQGKRSNIIGIVIVKQLIDPNARRAKKISDLDIHRLPSMTADMPLYDALNLFQTGRSHMAVVLDGTDLVTVTGVLTLEDIMEELIQEEIQDEWDVRCTEARTRYVTSLESQSRRRGNSMSGVGMSSGATLDGIEMEDLGDGGAGEEDLSKASLLRTS